MKVSIEEIEGVKHTVVYHGEKRLGYWRPLNSGYIKHLCHVEIKDNGEHEASDIHVATALSPLPRNPTADDARLLHLYAAHGLDVCGFYFSPLADDHNKLNSTKDIINITTCDVLDLTITVITHATNKQGERVGVAIYDRKAA